MTTKSLDTALPIHELFSADYLEYYRMLPLSLSDGRLRVAQAGEPHAEAHEDLCRTFQATVELVPMDEIELKDAIRRHFSAQESVVELVRDLAEPGDDSRDDSAALLADARDLAAQPPVIRFVNLLIRDAHAAGASDLHLEATRQGLRVRARVDGVLQELPSPPARLQAGTRTSMAVTDALDHADTTWYQYDSAGDLDSLIVKWDSIRLAQPNAPGLSFFRSRVYDQETGRWTQEDPIGLAGGINPQIAQMTGR